MLGTFSFHFVLEDDVRIKSMKLVIATPLEKDGGNPQNSKVKKLRSQGSDTNLEMPEFSKGKISRLL